MSNRIQAELKDIANVLRKEEPDFKELSTTIQQYEELVHGLSSIEIDAEESKNNVFFENGMALGTSWAAMCLKDAMRTKMFVKGLFEAVEDVRKTTKDPVHILYAGTGPFATLILPVLASFSSGEVVCTLLEVNDLTMSNMKSVINKCGFDNHVVEFVQADATTVKLNNTDQVDILLSETMQRALESEQQVPIVMNLLSQLREDVILIPELIDVIACQMSREALYRAETEDDFRLCLGSAVELSKRGLKNVDYSRDENLNIRFPAKVFKVLPETVAKYNELCLLTEIQVYGNTWLRSLDSGLTVPKKLMDLPKDIGSGRSFSMQYFVDDDPKIIFKEL